MAKKRKKYLVTTNSEAYACSLVTSPAVEELFVAFNEDKQLVEKFADEKKHMITGVVAIPNKPIYRRTEDGDEFDIVFSEEAIEKMSKDFLKEYRQHEVTLQHQENADGVYLVEQWIKSDMVYDKSLAVGLSKELPVGSWIQTYYVDSNDVWQRIVDGELRGFSLEAMIGVEEFEKQIEEDKNSNNMTIETNEMFWTTLKNTIKEIFSQATIREKEGDIEPVNIEDLEAQTETAVDTPVAEEPKVEEPKVEEPKEEPKVEEPKVEEPKVEEPHQEEPKVEEPKDNHLEDLVNSLKEEIEALKKLNHGLNDKIKNLEKEPSTKPVNTNAKQAVTTGVNGSSYQSWRETMRQMIG